MYISNCQTQTRSCQDSTKRVREANCKKVYTKNLNLLLLKCDYLLFFYEEISSAYVRLLQIVDTWTMHLDGYPNNETN